MNWMDGASSMPRGFKIEFINGICSICEGEDKLCTPEEYDIGAPLLQAPLRSMILRLNHYKAIRVGRVCSSCIGRAVEAYEFIKVLFSRGNPSLGERIRKLRRKLLELTQRVNASLAMGEPRMNSGKPRISGVVAPSGAANEVDSKRGNNAFVDAVYKCTVCSMTFQSTSALRAHRPVCCAWCPACGVECSGRSGLSRHARREHGHPPAILLCSRCFVQLPTVAHLKQHELIHRQPGRYECGYPECGLMFDNRKELITHTRSCHGSEVKMPGNNCRVCPRKFRTAAALKCHFRVHRRERALKLDIASTSK